MSMEKLLAFLGESDTNFPQWNPVGTIKCVHFKRWWVFLHSGMYHVIYFWCLKCQVKVVSCWILIQLWDIHCLKQWVTCSGFEFEFDWAFALLVSAKNPQPAASQAKNLSDSDVDSDSSNLSEDDNFVSNYASVRQKGQVPGKHPSQKGSNVVCVTPSDPDINADVLHQNLGFKTVGAGNKVRRWSSSFSYVCLFLPVCVFGGVCIWRRLLYCRRGICKRVAVTVTRVGCFSVLELFVIKLLL